MYSRNTQMKLFKITGGTADIQRTYSFDELTRVSKKTYATGNQKFYIHVFYRDGATTLEGATYPNSTQLMGYAYCDGEDPDLLEGACFYRYDALGNISEVRRPVAGTTEYSEMIPRETFRWYSYDANSQLVRVDDLETGETICFSYDDQGNIVRRTYHAYTRSTPGAATRTDTWTYGGADGNVLTSSTINGVTTNYSYAAYGIPTAWTENRALLWSNGTQLAAIGNAAFTYDGEGQRLSKTVSGKTTGYTYEGTNLIRQKNADGSRLFFLYDANGLIGFDYIPVSGSAQTYFYRFDGEGRITAVVDPAGDVVAQYAYDPWGVITAVTDADGNAVSSSHIGSLNPIRYKGYYYDAETGLYYLNSRYYDPEVCRFISADDMECLGADGSPLSYNLFAYCMNNPVNCFDANGNWSLPNWAKGAIGAVATVAAVTVTVATGGAAAPVLIGVAASTMGGATVGAVNHLVTTGSWEGAGKAALDGLADGFMTGGLCAFGGSVVGGAVRTKKNAKSGITIGKVGTFEDVAALAKTRHYSGLKEFGFIKKVAGQKAAETVGWWQNKCVVKGVMALRGAIYDCGGALTGAYAKEVALTKGYQHLYNIWLM